MPCHVLIIDDDPLQTKVIEAIVTNRLGYRVSTVDSGRKALNIINREAYFDLDLVILDFAMPEMNGLEALKTIKERRPGLPVIMLTAHGDIEKAVESMKLGASDFLQKQDAQDRLEYTIRNVLRIKTLDHEVDRLKRNINGQVMFKDILGNSSAIKDTIALAKKAANSMIPIHIEGESGCGKELFARAIHGCSERAGKPFIAVNCSAIPEGLAESILFGHEKGAFTGALYKNLGKFREANGGTLFLDEIGELPKALQAKILRALEMSEIQPVGSKQTTQVDVRIISATNRELEKEVAEGHFREDLFYRLNVFPIIIPPLRQRQEDIPLLMENFLQRFTASEKKDIKGFSKKANDLLLEYRWPGNVRELENAIFRAVILCNGNTLQVQDFPHVVRAMLGENSPLAQKSLEGRIHLGEIPLQDEQDHFRPMESIEQDVIRLAASHYRGHMSEIARRLGFSRSTLYRKIEHMGINLEKFKKKRSRK